MQNQNLISNLLKRIFTFILMTSVLFGALPTGAQNKRAATKTANTSQKKVAAKEQNTSSTENTFSKPENTVMSQAWQSGVLPAPLPVPAGNTDEVAAILAQKVAAKTNESLPALLTALQTAGFFITDKNGQVTLSPPDGKGQGLLINGWEVASVARMYGDNRTVNIIQLDQQLQSVPVLRGIHTRGENIGQLLIEGINRQAENTSNPFLRVWARFIIELGKNSAGKYDLKGARAAQINLDAVQHLLIMRRLYGDFWATAEKYKDEKPLPVSQNQPQAELVKADFSPNSSKNSTANNSAFPEFINASEDTKKPSDMCRMDGNTPTIQDALATTFGKGWEMILDKMANSDDLDIKKMGSRYKAFSSVANIMLVYAKFIHTYAALETVITAEDSAPLVRTQNAEPGGRKKLRAFVKMNIGEWQTYNCLRTSMNIMTGIDFATLNDGPLGGVGVQWSLTEGGAGDYYSNSSGVDKSGEQIVGFVAEKPKRIQDAGVGFGSGLRNLTFGKTDDKGISEAILSGTPQKNYKVDKVYQVRKSARVVTSIEIKSGEIKGDMVDVYGQWAAGLPGLIAMPAELLYRTSWAASGELRIPVIDWEKCTGDWAGTITYTRKHNFYERKTEKIVSNRGEKTIIKDMNNNYGAEIKFNGADADAFVFSDATYIETRDTWEMNACRVNEPMRRMSCRYTTKQNWTATDGEKAAVRVSVNRLTETYSLSFATPSVPVRVVTEERGTCSGQCSAILVKPVNANVVKILPSQSFTVPTQKLSASNALTITGSYSAEIAPSITVTVSWDLRQCATQANLNDPKSEQNQAWTFYAMRKIFEPNDSEINDGDSIFLPGSFAEVSPFTN